MLRSRYRTGNFDSRFKHVEASMRIHLQALCAVALLHFPTPGLRAQVPGEVFRPPEGTGTPLVAVSGFSGTAAYRELAAKLATEGFWVVLVDGKDVLFRKGDDFDPKGQAVLRAAVGQAAAVARSPGGKAALVGFSLGGGGVLHWGSALDDVVSRAVVFYPVVSRPGQDAKTMASDMRVPVLAFAAARDSYMDCCLVRSMRAIRDEANKAGRHFELVEFPEAEHAFNLTGPTFRADDTEVSWRLTLKFLRTR